MSHEFGGGAPPAFVGWYLLVWGVFTFYMWIASFRHNTALQLVFLTLWITFFVLAAGDLFGMAVFHKAGGFCGLLCAGIAAYLSAAEVINADYRPHDPADRAAVPASRRSAAAGSCGAFSSSRRQRAS